MYVWIAVVARIRQLVLRFMMCVFAAGCGSELIVDPDEKNKFDCQG